jgi:hypothetical protein
MSQMSECSPQGVWAAHIYHGLPHTGVLCSSKAFFSKKSATQQQVLCREARKRRRNTEPRVCYATIYLKQMRRAFAYLIAYV